MAAAWRLGERPRAEVLLARHPGLDDEDAVRLIYEEACLRQEAGEDFDRVSAEILGRFPRWRPKLALLLDCQRLFGAPAGGASDFPEAGEQLGDFRLLAELGRGAHGRTFLVSQGSLADRPLVLKIAPLGRDDDGDDDGDGEHLHLARLQHMHIVPLYFEQALAGRNLRSLVMPYLGGTTLDRVLGELGAASVPPAGRSGRDILDVLDRIEAARPISSGDAARTPVRTYLAQASYTQAICWIGSCLADALQYAHDRGLVHMDVKPSNILIAADGQPMLLDFHLARRPVSPACDSPERLGGTPGYLSPEQRQAMEAIRRGTTITAGVDGRSDLFSLGLSLYEALGGKGGTGAMPARSRPSLEECNSRVSPGLSDILRKCLADDPRDRYATAGALAQDLRRHLNDQPLRGVANRSPAERWRKWRRRSPAALLRLLLTLAALAAVVTLLAVANAQARQRTRRIDDALAQGRQLGKDRHYREATLAFEHGLTLASSLSDDDPRKRALQADLRRALNAQAADELHALVDLLRFRYGISPPADDEAEALFGRGLEIWKRRGLLRRAAGGGDDASREAVDSIRADLLDLAAVLADLRIHSGPAGAREGRSDEALQILQDARREFGTSPALERDLRAYRGLLAGSGGEAKDDGAAGADPAPAPRTAWEHYDLGRSYLRSGEHARAEDEFRRSVELQPGEFWPHFFRGVCAYRLGRYGDALAALDICVALAPRAAECYYDRAKVREALGQVDEAIRDDTRALELNPGFSDAALNRGTLEFRAGRHAEAIADLERARATAAGPRSLGLIAYNLAVVHIERKDWPAARACLRQAIACGNRQAVEVSDRLGLE
jgi:serine/threonine protein kinase/Flp pilus assembly protein TadD